MIFSVRVCARLWVGEHETVCDVVNPGEWFGETYAIGIAISNALNPIVIVEADHESDAIDILADSKEYGHLINVDENLVQEDRKEFGEVGSNEYRGDYSLAGNDGHVVDLTNCTFLKINKIEYFIPLDYTDSPLINYFVEAINKWNKEAEQNEF
jgi:hypothetical protein